MQGGDSNIRKAPYEDGVYFVKEPGGKESTWVVGQRYHLVKILGHGSFSCVVLAVDRASGEQVALKRVGDVLNSPENAKRVLREVCIMRRLDHPCIIKLKDVYVKPSDTGKLFYRGGKFVPASLDLYMAMEYMNQGDLFHLRGQLSESEVRSMTWQILCALEYLHAINVWHRDIKSANIMVAVAEGRRIVKVHQIFPTL
ncbi:hypothetical protein CEUSTIGMA_g8335.t1 [Chlamydomonas eustigma]|uniref:Protein kinase domain-containing protein n=1 Tax=Chlamydomonas eustigma TaxID=1157962 RepID=A0A250XDQ9_9CHLO|nr:hypothetical protein CEUSTIGMA_g8335.t1 [Chlamydomonas eustigma]|eukprot:GAX80900.1 hypothetical protein CEUSTIGMA_g8335.t1 [Chlamydomonas eustigma]